MGRTEFEYTYQADIINTGSDVRNVTASVTSNSPDTVVVDGTLTFGDVSAESAVTSGNTFPIRHNRLVPFDFEN